ncbi:hypothetical protein PR048_033043 [Dryococelus australis]|uniref:Uncharacterized protein n=1 Tax=Dryococelus australis TaxID=614101 RepID=A0ABQ9FZ43_9NEOP|nr:hypothetical protein PR048_033043 [Dryococelus australis]
MTGLPFYDYSFALAWVALTATGTKTYIYVVLYLTFSKLDPETHEQFEQEYAKLKLPTFKQPFEFVEIQSKAFTTITQLPENGRKSCRLSKGKMDKSILMS